MKNIFVLVILLITTCVYSDQIVSREGDIVTVIASGEYIMGDSDNRKEARTMALTQAKTNASEVAGTYIESNFESVTKQTNGAIVDKVTKKELRSFSAAILQSEITNDTMEILANKTTVYKVSIKARIDLATLRERVKQLGEDKAKKDRLIGLEKENQDLSSALKKLSSQMQTLENSKSVKPEEIKALREERDRLFTKLEKNEGASKLVFEKGSIQNEYERKITEVDEAINYIDSNFIKNLAQFATITIEKPRFLVDGDIGVNWSVSIRKNIPEDIFKFIVEKESKFDDFQENRFRVGLEYLWSKSKLFILLPNIGMEDKRMIPIQVNFSKYSTDNECYGNDNIICHRHAQDIYFHNQGMLQFHLSEEMLKEFSEVQAEVVYLNYPTSALPVGEPNFDHVHSIYDPGSWSRSVNRSCEPYKKGDRIISIDKITIQNDSDYFKIIMNKKPGTVVSLEIMRNNKKITFKQTVVRRDITHRMMGIGN